MCWSETLSQREFTDDWISIWCRQKVFTCPRHLSSGKPWHKVPHLWEPLKRKPNSSLSKFTHTLSFESIFSSAGPTHILRLKRQYLSLIDDTFTRPPINVTAEESITHDLWLSAYLGRANKASLAVSLSLPSKSEYFAQESSNKLTRVWSPMRTWFKWLTTLKFAGSTSSCLNWDYDRTS